MSDRIPADLAAQEIMALAIQRRIGCSRAQALSAAEAAYDSLQISDPRVSLQFTCTSGDQTLVERIPVYRIGVMEAEGQKLAEGQEPA